MRKKRTKKKTSNRKKKVASNPAAHKLSNGPTRAKGSASGGSVTANGSDAESDPVFLSIDEIVERLFSERSSDPSDAPKIFLELEEEDPSVDTSGAALRKTEAALNSAAVKAVGSPQVPDSVVLTPDAIAPDAEAFRGLKELVEDDVGDLLKKENEDARRARTALESLRRAGRLSKAALKETAAASTKAIEEAERGLDAAVLEFYRFSAAFFEQAAKAWEAMHPDFRHLGILVAAALLYDLAKALFM